MRAASFVWNHSPPKSSRAASSLPVPRWIVGVGAGAQADLAAFALPHRLLVLVQDLHVPARHRTSHRPLAHLSEREVRAERVRLRQAVVVENRDAVLAPEPANRLRIERLTGRAHDAERLRVAPTGVLDVIIARIAVGVVRTFVTS